MSRDGLAVLDGGKCILQLRGVRPFLSDKYDLTQHPNYKYTADFDKKNTFDVEKYLDRRMKLKADDEYDVNMGKAAQSTALSMVREIVFGVGFALLLPLFFGLDGVLYSMPLSDILTFIIALFLIIQTFHELGGRKRTCLGGSIE